MINVERVKTLLDKSNVHEGGYLKPFTRGGVLEMILSTVFCEKELAHQNCRAYKGDPYGHFATTFE